MVCRLTYQSANLERLFREVHRVYLLLESDLNIELNPTGEGEAALQMSLKTLQRRLRREGMNYQKIKESIRRDFVIEHLRNPKLPTQEIATMAGNFGSSSFSRMFRKWTGMSPATYREKIIQQN